MWIWPLSHVGEMRFFFFEHFFKMLMVFLDTWHQSTFQNQIVSYMLVNFAKKNHFFGSRFFKFHRHVIHFLCKKRAKKRLQLLWFSSKKFSEKMKKTRKIFQIFPTCDTKNQHFQEIFTYGWSWEKWYNLLKNFISDVLQKNLSNSPLQIWKWWFSRL